MKMNKKDHYITAPIYEFLPFGRKYILKCKECCDVETYFWPVLNKPYQICRNCDEFFEEKESYGYNITNYNHILSIHKK